MLLLQLTHHKLGMHSERYCRHATASLPMWHLCHQLRFHITSLNIFELSQGIAKTLHARKVQHTINQQTKHNVVLTVLFGR